MQHASIIPSTKF